MATTWHRRNLVQAYGKVRSARITAAEMFMHGYHLVLTCAWNLVWVDYLTVVKIHVWSAQNAIHPDAILSTWSRISDPGLGGAMGHANQTQGLEKQVAVALAAVVELNQISSCTLCGNIGCMSCTGTATSILLSLTFMHTARFLSCFNYRLVRMHVTF